MPGDSSAESPIAQAEDSVDASAAAGKKKKKKPLAVVKNLEAAIEARGWSIEEVCKALAAPIHPTTLWRMLKGEVKPKHELIEEILDIIGEPLELFWGRYVDRESGLKPLGLGDLDHAHLMRQVAGRPATQLPEGVASVLEAGLPALQEDPLEILPTKLHELDELRLVDKEAANEQCLQWIEASHERMLADRLESRRLAELLIALGSFASILRTRGESRLAASLLAETFESVGELQSGLVFASLLCRSSPVLTDGGYPKLALAHLHQARDIFSGYGESLFFIAASLSLGVHYRYLGKYDQAQRYFEMTLGHPEVGETDQAKLLSNLAQVFEETHQPELAIDLIESLENGILQGKQGRLVTYARWIKANAQAATDELEYAAEGLADLRSDVARYCTAIDPLLHFFDYAGVLIRLGDERRLAAATERLLEHLPHLRLDAKLSESVIRAISRIETRSIRLSELKRIRRRLAA